MVSRPVVWLDVRGRSCSRRKPYSVLAACAIALLNCLIAPSTAAAANAQEVRAAIDKAKQYLYSAAQGAGKDNWELVPAPEKLDPGPEMQWHVESWQWG